MNFQKIFKVIFIFIGLIGLSFWLWLFATVIFRGY